MSTIRTSIRGIWSRYRGLRPIPAPRQPDSRRRFGAAVSVRTNCQRPSRSWRICNKGHGHACSAVLRNAPLPSPRASAHVARTALLDRYATIENSSRYFARPDTPRIFSSSRINSIKALSGTSHSHVTPCVLAGSKPKRG